MKRNDMKAQRILSFSRCLNQQISAATTCSGFYRLLLVAALLATPVYADSIEGTEDSDNNSFSFFPVWRGQLKGTPRDDTVRGYAGHDILFGKGADDRLFGGRGRDKLYGDDGDDVLTGGFGDRDLLLGGPGDDHYHISDALDLVREREREGQDTVHSFVNYLLPKDVENLFLMPNHNGLSVISGGTNGEPSVHFQANCAAYEGETPCEELGTRALGNTLDNRIFGNGMDNQLRGMDGDDVLFAGAGDDRVEGGDGSDILAAFSVNRDWWTHEDDTLRGGTGADVFVIGISGRPGGLVSWVDGLADEIVASERFPQYLGQGSVTIKDFNWEQGDKIEVYGDISRYSVELEYSVFCGGYCAIIYWNGRAAGYGSKEYVGKVLHIREPNELDVGRDFL